MPSSMKLARRTLGPLAILASCLLMVAASGSTDIPSLIVALPDGAIRPTERQRQVAPHIAEILESNHYSRRLIDKAFSSEALDRYVNALDSQRSYFTLEDLAGFERWRGSFDDMIHSGQLDPGFAIFNSFQQRNRERMQYALELLKTEPDWSVSEQINFDREKVPWPKDTAELNELWRKRIKSDALSLMLTGKSWPEVVEVLRKRYEHVITRINQISAEDVFESLMNSYTQVYDPHSNYFSPRSSDEYRIQMSLSYEGIGASLLLTDDYVTISSLLAGGPAAVAGALKPNDPGTLKTNDRILAVGQGNAGPLTEVIGWRLDDVVQLIRGKGGTSVRLQILPAGAAPGTDEHVVTLQRGKVTLETQAAKKDLKLIKVGDKTLRVGVITIPEFYEDVQAHANRDPNYRSTTRDVRRLIGELQADGGIDALVLDLRGDGGGYLPEATALTGLFVGRGPVVQVKNRDGELDVLNGDERNIAYDGPLEVLVDRTSASASEIFAGAIQDYHRGLIAGQTTFGKGTVQSLIPLDRWSNDTNQGQITVTIEKFYRITGESTQLHGVEPDLALPSAVNPKDVGESSMEHPLPWDRITPVAFNGFPSQSGWIPMLQRDEGAREATDPNYKWLLDGLTALDVTRKDHSQSLNLKERESERTSQEQDRLARENVRRIANGQPPLKSADEMKDDEIPDVVLQQAAGIAADLAVQSGSGALLASHPATASTHSVH
jgi:carboxyl-terminal processing protease